jgi:hypothetical protein
MFVLEYGVVQKRTTFFSRPVSYLVLRCANNLLPNAGIGGFFVLGCHEN